MAYDLLFDNISRHIQLNEQEKTFFLSILKHRKIRKRQYLLQAGDICRHETYILSGCLRAYHVDDNGFEHVTMFGIEDWWISDLHSLLSQSPANQNIDALEDSEVLQIEKQNLEELYHQVPKFERYFRIMLQNAFVSHQQRILQNISLSGEERYRFFLEKYPQFAQRLPQKQIALYLGITPEFLSKIRKQFTRKK